jgi:crossover junction endodeoxyribonuclease RuvC
MAELHMQHGAARSNPMKNLVAFPTRLKSENDMPPPVLRLRTSLSDHVGDRPPMPPVRLGAWQMFAFRASCGKKARQAGRHMRIIGIDPGLRVMGWGVIEVAGSRLRHIDHGTCESEGDDLASRLLSLYRQLTEVLRVHAPDSAAVENTFVNRDGVGTLKLGQARAIALLVPAQAGLPVAEYAPNHVKKSVVGAGHAEKQQVAHMVKVQLGALTFRKADSADALAIAICHAHHMQSAANTRRVRAGA